MSETWFSLKEHLLTYTYILHVCDQLLRMVGNSFEPPALLERDTRQLLVQQEFKLNAISEMRTSNFNLILKL